MRGTKVLAGHCTWCTGIIEDLTNHMPLYGQGLKVESVVLDPHRPADLPRSKIWCEAQGICQREGVVASG